MNKYSGDILVDGPISLNAAARLFPKLDGRPRHPVSLWRWCRVGRNGITLPYVRLMGRIATSERAVHWFLHAITEADRPVGRDRATPRGRNSKQRAADIAEAEKVLAASGI